MDFRLPELGENITSGTVVKVAVSKGDSISKEQTLFELETDKATIEVPSPVAGKVDEILVKDGDQVAVGQVVAKLTAGAPSGDKVSGEETRQTSNVKRETAQPSDVKSSAADTGPAASASRPTEQQATSHEQPASAPVDPSSIHLAVIGGGPGGYAAAFLAADLGMSVTLIDKEANPGGVCLFRGCIPSKALLHAAKILSESRDAAEIGIEFAEPIIHLDKLRGWKKSVVDRLTGGLGQLSKQRKIKYVRGTASFRDSSSVNVKTDAGEEIITFDRAIIATGSVPVHLPFAPKSRRVLDSTSALELEDVPQRLLVIGGGYIGLELGTVYHELGSKVSVVEMLPNLLMGADRDLAVILEKRIKSKFESIMTNTKVTAIEEKGEKIVVGFEDKDGQKFSQEFDKILMAIGRKPTTAGLNLEATQVQTTDRGFIRVDAQRRTTDPCIYAIGDIAGDPMLAHKASHEGRVAVEAIAGHKVAFEPLAIPAVVFTDPEVAWCGLTEGEAKAQGLAFKVAKFPWGASGRAITLNRTDGLTKLIIDSETERILGVSIVGVGAGEMISEGVVAVEMGSVATDLKLSIHPHPTLSETVMESAETFFGQSTHVYRPKR